MNSMVKDNTASQTRAACMSFDVFDTAVLRRVLHPTDVFTLAAHRAADAPLTAVQFKAQRQQAERQARKRVLRERGQHEITLDDIYSELATLTGHTVQSLESLKRAEIEVEIEVAQANPYIKAIYDSAIRAGTPVLFISDMYLPADVIERMLRKCGYDAHHRLFVSSEYGVTKHGGELYVRALAETGFKPADVLHHGDNRASDVEMARKQGLNAVYYPKSLDHAVEMGDARLTDMLKNGFTDTESRIAALTVNKFYAHRPAPAPTKADFWYRLGYDYIGVMYYGFMVWLLDQVQNEKLEHIYFLARDGYILEKVCELFEEKTGLKLHHSYLYASRRVYNFPMITAMDESAFYFLLASGREELNVADFLLRIGFDANTYRDQIAQVGFSGADQIVSSKADFDRMRALFVMIEQDIIEKAASERQLLRDYLAQEGLWDTKRVAVVDVGWNGTMQKSLNKLIALLGEKVALYGYYFGVFDTATVDHAYGYIVQHNKPHHNMLFILEGIWMIEFMLFAPHGSVIGFERQEGRIVPQMAEETYDEYRVGAVTDMQAGALDFVRDMLEAYGKIPLTIDEALRPMRRLLFDPTPLEREMLGNLALGESFGNLGKALYVANPTDEAASLLKPKQLVREYKQASWKIAYLKRSKANPLYKFTLHTLRRIKWART